MLRRERERAKKKTERKRENERETRTNPVENGLERMNRGKKALERKENRKAPAKVASRSVCCRFFSSFALSR